MGKIIEFKHSGEFKRTYRFLEAIREKRIYKILNTYGAKGVQLLSNSTPMRTGTTAHSWSYRVVMEGNLVGIEWLNSNMASDGRTPVAILIQMGHGTRTGGYVPPRDFINPAMKPLFDDVVRAIDGAVKSL